MWKAGKYDGSDRFSAMLQTLMQEQAEAKAEEEDEDDEPSDRNGDEGGERKLRVEDLYPSDDFNPDTSDDDSRES